MKNIAKICIRLFLLFNVFQFINNFLTSIGNYFSVMQLYNFQMGGHNINQIDVIMAYLPFILLWIFFIILIIILWKKSEKIANKIVGNNNQEFEKINLDFNNILSIGLIILGIYLIISSLPVLFSYTSNYIVSKTRFVNNEYFLKEYSIKDVIEIIGIIIKIIVSYIIIRYNNKIIDKINYLKNKQSNVT